MNRVNKSFVAMLMLAAMLFTGVLQAMEIRQFDKMADQDQGEFIAELIVGAQKVLKDGGRPDLAAKVHTLFNTRHGDDGVSLGMVEFERNVARPRLADARNVEKDSKAPRLEVEDAMAVTLEANGIALPDSFFTMMKNFKPKHSSEGK